MPLWHEFPSAKETSGYKSFMTFANNALDGVYCTKCNNGRCNKTCNSCNPTRPFKPYKSDCENHSRNQDQPPNKLNEAKGLFVALFGVLVGHCIRIHLVIGKTRQKSKSEINSIWFTQQEIDQTIKVCQDTVQCMQDGIPLADEDSEFTTRGLEYMTTSGFDIATSSLDAVKTVL